MTFLTHWKTTVQSILTGIIGLSGLSATPQIAILPVKWAGYLALAGVAAKIILGCFQKDAGKTDGTLPGSDKLQSLDSHEIPNNPNATIAPKETA